MHDERVQHIRIKFIVNNYAIFNMPDKNMHFLWATHSTHTHKHLSNDVCLDSKRRRCYHH